MSLPKRFNMIFSDVLSDTMAIDALSQPEAIKRLFDKLDADLAFFPYYPEMLDYELIENEEAEQFKLVIYRNSFL